MNTGHMGTYLEANGGKFGIAAVQWAKWLLHGNTTATHFFLGNAGAGTAQADGWTAVSANLDALKVTSLD